MCHKKIINAAQTSTIHQRFINGNQGSSHESDEDILRSKKGGNRLVALVLISVVGFIILALSC